MKLFSFQADFQLEFFPDIQYLIHVFYQLQKIQVLFLWASKKIEATPKLLNDILVYTNHHLR